MFLPDGKALLMDQDLYKQILEKSIVIDLIDTYNNQENIQNQLDNDYFSFSTGNSNLQIED
jgi:hypothetical protein